MPLTAALPKLDKDEVVLRSQKEKIEAIQSLGNGKWRLPNVEGLTMRDVLELLGDADLNFNFSGSGVALAQQPKPGSVVPAGASVTIRFGQLL